MSSSDTRGEKREKVFEAGKWPEPGNGPTTHLSRYFKKMTFHLKKILHGIFLRARICSQNRASPRARQSLSLPLQCPHNIFKLLLLAARTNYTGFVGATWVYNQYFTTLAGTKYLHNITFNKTLQKEQHFYYKSVPEVLWIHNPEKTAKKRQKTKHNESNAINLPLWIKIYLKQFLACFNFKFDHRRKEDKGQTKQHQDTTGFSFDEARLWNSDWIIMKNLNGGNVAEHR